MWKREENQQPSSNPAPTPPPTRSPSPSSRPTGSPAVIGPTINIKGDLAGEEDLIVQGYVEGKIELRRHCVTVGNDGRVKADIFGRSITVEGTVEGNLYGEEQVVVRSSGSARGNITAPRVSLEDGANFKGSIDMEPKGAGRAQAAAGAQKAGAAKAPSTPAPKSSTAAGSPPAADAQTAKARAGSGAARA